MAQRLADALNEHARRCAHVWLSFDAAATLASHEAVVEDLDRTGAHPDEALFCSRCTAVRAASGGRPAWLSALQVATPWYGDDEVGK
jgi:hypothetical protein